MVRIALDALEEEGVAQPALRGVEVGDRAEADFGVEVLGEVEVEGAFEDSAALNEGTVLRLELVFAEDDGDAFFV